MPLETATYISDLVVTNPANSDGLNQADDHMRLIKSTVKATFPNFTAAALSSTQSQLDAAVSAVVSGTDSARISLGTVSLPSLTPIGDTDTGLWSPAANQINVSAAGALVANFSSGGVSITGSITATGTITSTGAITAPGIAPIGSMTMWLSNTLPPSTEGVWVWANGGAYSRTTYATAFARMGTTFGTGDGSTTFNVIDMQDVTPVGRDTMGGAGGNSLLSSISSGLKGVLNGLFGANQKTLATTNLPAQTPSGTVNITSQGTIALGGSAVRGGASGAGTASGGSFTGLVDGGAISPTISGIAASFSGTAFAGQNSTAFDLVQPSRTVNFIVRLA